MAALSDAFPAVLTWHDVQADAVVVSILAFNCRVRFERKTWQVRADRDASQVAEAFRQAITRRLS